MALRRAKDKKPVIKKQKFDAPVVLKVKQLAKENPKWTIRDIPAALEKEFPNDIPSKSTVHRILSTASKTDSDKRTRRKVSNK